MSSQTTEYSLGMYVPERAPLNGRGDIGVGMWKRETMELEDIVSVTLFT